MKRRLTTALVLATIGFWGCDEEAERNSFPEYRSYRHDLYATPEECEAAQQEQGFLFGCSQEAYFFTDGSVMLVLTDVHNWGTYEIEDDEVILDFDLEHAEVARWDFVALDDSTLVDDAGNDWRLVATGAESCRDMSFDLCER